MKNKNYNQIFPTILERIASFSKVMGGVYLQSDLTNLICLRSRLATARLLNRLVNAGVVLRVQRGIYRTKEFDLWQLAGRIVPKSYVSMDSVLARNGLIGSVPEFSLSAVHTGRGRTIKTGPWRIRFHSISKDLFFGFQSNTKGVRVADSEKAFLDMLYFYTKGVRFVIDPLQEIDISKLNRQKIFQYLTQYKNPKFVKFVKGVLDEKS